MCRGEERGTREELEVNGSPAGQAGDSLRSLLMA